MGFKVQWCMSLTKTTEYTEGAEVKPWIFFSMVSVTSVVDVKLRDDQSRGTLMVRLLAAVSVLVMLFGGLPAVAQSTDNNPLGKVKSLKCTFPIYSSGSWKGGEPKAELKQAQQFSLDIDEIDADGGTARITGTSGPTHVTALLTISSLHFVERTVTGTLTVTTVFASEGNVKSYRAVHSRHDYLPMSLPGYVSEPSVSQNYGSCEVGADSK